MIKKIVKALIQALIALAIVAVGVVIVKGLFKTKPEAVKVAIVQEPPVVTALKVQKTSVPIMIKTQGEISPTKRTTLSAQVVGKVLSVSPKYEVGESFLEGDVIITIEDIDYRTALVNAEATKSQAEANLKQGTLNLSDAQVALELEQAKVEQAKRDWAKLGRGEKASDLLLRKPQIKAAENRISAVESQMEAAQISIKQAQVNIEKAQRDLERTRIRAPYACQIEQKQIDLGAFVATGTPLATVYEKGKVEARLPIALEDISYVKIGAEITATAQYGNERKEWKGKISRSENRIDPATRSAFVIASFTGEELPPVGLFADVELGGKELKDVFVVPRIALRGQNQVIVISEDDTLTFREVKVSRTADKMVYLSEGLEEGDYVCTTVMSTPIEGMKVTVAED